jgi:hypothetical protein
LAVDVDVEDWIYPPGTEDDWLRLAQAFRDHELNVDSALCFPDYIHAFMMPAYEPYVTVEFERNEIEPGYEEEYNPQLPELVRQIYISGHLSESLAPYLGKIMFRVFELPCSGGHVHYDRPMNHVTDPYVISEIDPDGSFYDILYEDLCRWGGKIVLQAFYIHEENVYSGVDTLSIRFDYLVPLDLSHPNDYDTTGTTIYHPINFYIDHQHHDKILEIAEAFNQNIQQQFPGAESVVLLVNDISLHDGGQFDIGPRPYAPDWELWEQPHQTHRRGCHADLQYDGINRQHPYYWLLFDAIFEVTGIEPKEKGNHMHTRFGCRPWE